MPITMGDEVTIHYTATLDNGDVIESTRDREPLCFTIGEKKLLPALEEALIGSKKGEQKEISVPPDKGFGERREGFIQEVPKSMVDEKITASKSDVVELRSEDGSKRLVTVHEIKDDSIIFDLNHPLAGKTLKFDVEVIDVSSKEH